MKKIKAVLLLTLMICSKSFAVDITEQLLKLEGMYERGSITEQEFLKAKSILLEINVTTSKKIEKNIKKAVQILNISLKN